MEPTPDREAPPPDGPTGWTTGSSWQRVAPAKLNLTLAVTGRLPNGYHELVSLAAPLAWGDRIELTIGGAGSPDTLECPDAALGTGPDNLVCKAWEAYRRRVRLPFSLHFRLVKTIPMEAGLGGGSSDAAATLLLLQAAAGHPLGDTELLEAAAETGSDVPFFLTGQACVMRGRGEILTRLEGGLLDRLRGTPALLLRPPFGIATAWAYRRWSETHATVGGGRERAEQRLAGLQDKIRGGLAPPWDLRQEDNDLAVVIFRKYLAYKVFTRETRAAGLPDPLLTGSGSTVFWLGLQRSQTESIRALAADVFGAEIFLQETFLS